MEMLIKLIYVTNMSFRYLYVYLRFLLLWFIIVCSSGADIKLKSRTFWDLWFYSHVSLNAH